MTNSHEEHFFPYFAYFKEQKKREPFWQQIFGFMVKISPNFPPFLSRLQISPILFRQQSLIILMFCCSLHRLLAPGTQISEKGGSAMLKVGWALQEGQQSTWWAPSTYLAVTAVDHLSSMDGPAICDHICLLSSLLRPHLIFWTHLPHPQLTGPKEKPAALSKAVRGHSGKGTRVGCEIKAEACGLLQPKWSFYYICV